MSVDFDREQAWWDAKASTEEHDRGDEPINRALRWREIERHLDGVRSVLCVGGGTGAFSIPLARRGLQVTHLDLSSAMIEIAREKAGDLSNIRFLQGNAVDLSRFPDRAFDLVLNTDGAISFCGDRAVDAVREGCRVTGGTLILSVSHRANMVVEWFCSSVEVLGHISPAVHAMLERGQWHQDQFEENALLSAGSTQDYLGAIHAFLPGELRAILETQGLHVMRCGGLGSLALLCRQQALERLRTDAELYQAFLDLCEAYDRDVLPDGPGTRHRAGLIAVARRVG